jgi:hypothetical protein
MLKKLLIVAASGALLALATLSLAWVVGGKDFRDGFSDGEGWSWTIDDGEEYKGPKKTRDFVFDGAQVVTISIPVDLRFTRGDESKMVVEGPAEAIDRLEWKDGRLTLPGEGHLRNGLAVTIVAPQIQGLDIESAADIDLAGLDQDSFSLKAGGAVELVAAGRVDTLDLIADGAGELDLARVAAKDAKVRINGVGEIDLAATGNVDIAINGAGTATLHKKPATVKRRINGVGEINHAY